jgi:hypothetical protein
MLSPADIGPNFMARVVAGTLSKATKKPRSTEGGVVGGLVPDILESFGGEPAGGEPRGESSSSGVPWDLKHIILAKTQKSAQ